MRLLSKLCLLAFFVCLTFTAFSQVAIGTGATAPNPDTNAVLLLEGNGSQGIIIPKVNSLGNFGKSGMIVYNTSTGTVHYFNTTWVQVGAGAGGTQGIQIVGNKVLIGTGAGFSTEFSIANTAPSVNGQILMWDSSLNAGAGGWTSSANTAPLSVGQVLKWNGTRWEPGTDNTGASVLPSGQLFVGSATNVATATPPSSLPLSNFGVPTADLSLNTRRITNLATPTAATDATTKAYVDAADALKISTNVLTNGGDLLYHDGVAAARLPRGTNGQVLQSTATGIQWTPASTGGDMLKSTYDPTNINGSAFNLSNHTGQITTAQITDANVTTAKLANNAVDATKIANGAVGLTQLANGPANNVLTTNGSGVPTWAAGSTGVTNVSAAGGTPLSITNPATTPVINIAAANGSTDGYLRSSDWNNFNGKLSSIPSLGGDISGTLSSVSVDKLKGIAISGTAPVTNQVLQYNGINWAPAPVGSGTITGVTAGTGLSGGGASGTVTLNLANTAVATGSYGTTTSVGQFTVDQQGRITSASNLAIPTATSSTTGLLTGADWSTFNSKLGSGAIAGGDLSGTYPSPTISTSALTGATIVTAINNTAAQINGPRVDPTFGPQAISTNNALSVGPGGLFSVNSSGNITKINGVTTSFPAASAAGVLTNDGAGTLSWASSFSTSNVIPRGSGTGLVSSTIQDNGTTASIGTVLDPNKKLVVSNSTTGIVHSIYATNSQVGAGSSIGIGGDASGSTNTNFGVYGTASGSGTGATGVYGLATGTTGINYGIYGIASGAPTNWAGYFNGNAAITGNLYLAPGSAPAPTADKLYNVGGSLFWNGTNISSGGSGWALGGNTGTVDGIPGTGTNYIGTTNNVPLNFMVNNTRSGRIDPTLFSTFFGFSSGQNNSGVSNTGMGNFALSQNTSGSGNTGVGASSLSGTTIGNDNTAVGNGALFFNSTGSRNAAFGQAALSNSSIASGNTAMGNESLQFTTGQNNTALGGSSGVTNTTGNNNTFFGYQADATTINLTNATAIGYNAKVGASNSLVLGGTGGDAVNVGIGITTPAQKLDVNGNVRATQFIGDGSLLTNLPAGTETDPTVKAISGIVKSNGTLISAATAGTDYLTPTGSAAGLTGFPTLNQNTTGNAATATALASGRTIALTGDVTYTSPSFDGSTNITGAATVARLQGRNIVNTLPTNGQVLKWNNTLSQWEPAPDDVGGGATPTLNNGQILIGDGTSNSAAALSGDAQLSAGVITIQPNAVTSSKILDGTIAGADLANNITINTTGNITAANFTGNGSGLTGITATPSGAAGGDLSGSFPNPTVSRVNGTALSGLATGLLKNTTGTGVPTIAVAGTDYLTPTGSAATLTGFPIFNQNTTGSAASFTGALAGDVTGTQGATVIATSAVNSAKIADGSVAGVDLANNITINTTGNITAANFTGNGSGLTGITATPSGTAGGDLSGTFPNPTVSRVNGTALSGLATGLLKNTTGTGVPTIAVAGTDYLTPTGSAATLTGFPILNQNTTGSAASFTGPLVGDVTGPQGATVIAANAVNSAKIADGSIADIDIATGIAGSKIIPNFSAQNISTTGTLTTGTAGAFSVNATGNITKINGATTSFPASNAAGVLTNDGAGVLTWGAGSGWGLTGNTLTGTEKLGSINAQPLVFQTTNTERMRIDVTGNVGIGTTSPKSPLQIGNAFGVIDDAANSQNIIVRGLYSDGTNFRNIGTTGSSAMLLGEERTGLYTFPAGAADAVAASPSMRFNVRPSGVGIQVDNPIETFQVNGATYLNPITAPGVTTDRLYNVGGSLFWNGTNISSGGSGSVTNVSVTSANGFAGSVVNPTTTPVISIGTPLNGLLRGNGTGIAVATAGTDYLTPILTNGSIFVGNGSNIATAVAMSGDATINNTGAVTIANGAISGGTGGKILDATITGADLATNIAISTTGNIAAANFNGNGSGLTGLLPAQIPSLDASKITSGTFTAAQIPSLDASKINTGSLSVAQGGTSQSTYATGDLLYASAANTLSKLPIGAATQVLTVTGGVPTWAAAGSGWGLTGNTLTGTERIGSDNAQPLAFETTNTERMRIDATGNVGIGTTSPSTTLHVVGDIMARGTTRTFYTSDAGAAQNNSIITLDQSAIGGFAGLLIKGNDNVTNFPTLGLSLQNSSAKAILGAGITGIPTAVAAGAETMDLTFNTKAAAGTSLERMRISSTGNVGIGVTNPVTGLDVFSNNGIRLNSYLGAGSTASGSAYLGANLYQGYANNFWYWANTNGSVGGAAIGLNSSSASNSIQFFRAAGASTANAIAGALQESMRIDAAGNVGIATSTPQSALDVVGQIFGRTGIIAGVPGNGNQQLLMNVGAGFSTIQAINPSVAFNNLALNPSGGNVGIGTTSPIYPLQVNQTALYNSAATHGVYSNPTGFQSSASNLAVGIYSSGAVLAGWFWSFSDARIKEKLSVSNSAEDLKLLMRLKVTDYSHIDKIAKGSTAQKGFIAQEVKEILPDAVNILPKSEFVPSIYSQSKSISKSDLGLRIELSKAHDLKVGDRVRFLDGSVEFKEIVTEIPTLTSFIVKNEFIKASMLFIYGKEISDMHTVDYDRIYTLGVSAIQELNKKLEAQQQVIDSLQAQDAESKKKIALLEASLSKVAAGETELNNLKSEIEKIKAALGLSVEATVKKAEEKKEVRKEK